MTIIIILNDKNYRRPLNIWKFFGDAFPSLYFFNREKGWIFSNRLIGDIYVVKEQKSTLLKKEKIKNYYSLNVFPQNTYVEILTPKDDSVRRWGLW